MTRVLASETRSTFVPNRSMLQKGRQGPKVHGRQKLDGCRAPYVPDSAAQQKLGVQVRALQGLLKASALFSSSSVPAKRYESV